MSQPKQIDRDVPELVLGVVDDLENRFAKLPSRESSQTPLIVIAAPSFQFRREPERRVPGVCLFKPWTTYKLHPLCQQTVNQDGEDIPVSV